MLKLKVNEEVMTVEAYLERVKKDPEALSQLKQGHQFISGECKTAAIVTLCLNEVVLNHQLALEIATDENELPFFQFTHRMDDRVLGTRQLKASDADHVVMYLWLEEVQWFVCAGLSSFFSGQWLSPQEAELKLEAYLKETTQALTEPKVQDQLILQMGCEFFPLKELIKPSASLKKLQFKQLLEVCYHQFIQRFHKFPMRKFPIVNSKDERFIQVFKSEYTICVEEEDQTLPIIFCLGLQADEATADNDGVCSAQWCFGIYYQKITTYLPIGRKMEFDEFKVEDFQVAMDDMLNQLSRLIPWLELLALEVKSGLTFSSNVVFNEYQTFLEEHPSLWTLESGQLHFSYRPKPSSSVVPEKWSGQPTPQQYEQWIQQHNSLQQTMPVNKQK